MAFGLLSSRSRLNGSGSYRVPWNVDDEAVDVLRHFTRLKCRMMPYLYAQAMQARDLGLPMMRAMLLEFPSDPSCHTLDRQYLLGNSLLGPRSSGPTDWPSITCRKASGPSCRPSARWWDRHGSARRTTF